MKGFGTVDGLAGDASFKVSALRPACGPTAIRYWIEAAPRASKASRDTRSSQSCSGVTDQQTVSLQTARHPRHDGIEPALHVGDRGRTQFVEAQLVLRAHVDAIQHQHMQVNIQ